MTLVSASGPSHALGFGKPASRAILGDTLLVTVPVRLEAGEEITDECLAADVYFGDEKVSGGAVRAQVQSDGGDRVLKVSTTALINEPVVTIYLAAGCHARMTRKFVAFADPPGMALPSVVEPAALTPAHVAAVDGRAGEGRQRRAAAADKPRQAAREGKARDGAEVLARADDTPVMSAKAARVAPDPVGGDMRPSQRAGLRAEQSLGAATPAPVGEPGRLLLDGGEAEPVELHDLRMTASLATIIQADDPSPQVLARRNAAAAMWRALNATPEAMVRDRQRIADLEQRLGQLTAENQRATQALAEAQGLGGSAKWLAILGVLAVVAAAAAVYFARQLKARGGKGKDAWWQSQIDSQVNGAAREPVSDPAAEMERTSAFVRTPGTSPEPPKAAGAVRPAGAAARPAGKSAMSPTTAAQAGATPAATVSSSTQAAQPVTRQNLHAFVPDATVPAAFGTTAPAALTSRAAEPLREVSVEELIDLEQQAEFFVVLGQDDAAVSLLEGHVTHTTGASPLPFLKLLDIHRRLGRRDDYERVQTQFNERFNAHAPSWDSDQQQSHTLEDYPGVLERLQALWNTPAKAMEVLEKSLTRPDSSAEDTFELPAYRELLFLYAVARDLSEREPHERANVDLLLPSLGGDDAEAAPVQSDGGATVEDSGEPLMATRPIKAQPEALPSMSLDFHLDDLPEPSDTAKHH